MPCVFGAPGSAVFAWTDVPSEESVGSDKISGLHYGKWRGHTAQLAVFLVVWFDICVNAFVLGLLAASFSVHKFV